MKGKTCCVTGHRDLPQKEINHVRIFTNGIRAPYGSGIYDVQSQPCA